jgi:hypothetical protein
MNIRLIAKLTTGAAVAVALMASNVQAAKINGGISFAGDFRPVDGSGTVVSDLTTAAFLKFGPDPIAGIGPSFVTAANGDFSSIAAGSVAAIASPIAVNPAGTLPGSPIWSVGGFSLTLSFISEEGVSSGTLRLSGVGTITGGGFDPTPGTWIATLNTIAGTFSWSFSSGANPCNGKIGDFVWRDDNGNGCQDANEPGIDGVTVNLYSGCGQNATLLMSTTTTNGGKYLFDGLCAGQYTVSFVTPQGYNRTLAHQSCDGSGNPTPETDSDCECDDGQPCGICVTLTTDNSQDLTIDCGYIPSNPGLELIKTSDKSVVSPGEIVTYHYVVTNTGSLTISNINIVDDNGTPLDPTDDYTVNATPFTLAPGESATFDIPHISEPLCTTIGGTNFPAGTLTVNVLASGDVEVLFLQSQNLNDNRYGTNATVATGWKNGHKFSDLTGSDEADFRFTDGNGKVVLEFQVDYISAATSAKFGDGVTINYPSGYGTLGPLGGDGKMIVGASSNVLSAHTTFSDTINQPQFVSGFTINSPPETSPLSDVSVPPGWNYTDGFYVKVSKNAFGAAGFSKVTIPYLHNSPSKSGVNLSTPTNLCDCVENHAAATGVAIVGGTSVSFSASDFEEVCPSTGTLPGTCNIIVGTLKFDKKTVQVPIKNNGSSDIFMSDLTLTWPQGINGTLVKVSLNGDAFTGPAKNSPVALGSADWVSDPNKRKIAKGQSKTLVLTFQNNVDKIASDYSGGVVKFGTDAACQKTFLP